MKVNGKLCYLWGYGVDGKDAGAGALTLLPPSLADSATADVLRAIIDLDLSELQGIEPPRRFGRD